MPAEQRPKKIPRLWCDPVFMAALGAGVIVWFVLGMALGKSFDFQVLARHPQALLLVCVVYPVVEEIIFRGALQEFLQGRLRERRPGLLSHANLATSVLFSAAHFALRPGIWSVTVFAPSLLFGYFKERHRSLIPPILLHGLYNLGPFLMGWVAFS